MADVTVQVEEARADIRKAGAAINWMLCDWQAGRAEKLDLTASGNGGWDEFKTHLQVRRFLSLSPLSNSFALQSAGQSIIRLPENQLQYRCRVLPREILVRDMDWR